MALQAPRGPGRIGIEDKDRLLRGLRSGDSAAIERFVDLYGSRIFGFGMKVCGHREDAEDVMQETLIKALSGIGKLRSPEALETWLYRIAVNMCRMRRRHERVTPGSQPSRDAAQVEPERAGQTPGAPQAERRLLEKERFLVLTRAVQTLPKRLRLAVILRDLEGFSTREVAKILGTTEGNTKVLLHRARLRVRKLVEETYSRAGAGAGGSP